MIPIFEGKKLEELTEADLNKLVELKVRENRFIDYKRDMYRGNDEQKTEMLADITAFANAHGGYLFIGIDEDAEAQAREVLGIDDFNQAAEFIRNLCQTSIDEYIQGLRVQAIQLANGKGVVLISIPNSPNKPHMVTFKKKNRFYIRRDEGKELMNVEEIRDTVITVEDYMGKLEEFLNNRKYAAQEELSNIGEVGCWMILMASPIYLNRERLDVAMNDAVRRTIANVQNSRIASYELPLFFSNSLITLEGISYFNFISGVRMYFDLWNTGYIEFGISLELFSKVELEKFHKRELKHILTYELPNPYIPTIIYLVCHLIMRLWRIEQVYEPVVFKLLFVNAVDIKMSGVTTGHKWSKSEIEIMPLRFYLDSSPAMVAEEIITKLFRCFGEPIPIYNLGVPRSPLFDANHNYKFMQGLIL